VNLPEGIQDDEYMDILQESVDRAMEKVRPSLVLYDAGVDVYKNDKLGRLHLSEEGIRRRDRWVLDRCVSNSIPVAAVVGGGYDRDVDALARRHAIVHEESGYVWRKHGMWNASP
jgi:acetoin utilization deacetylase AcuC-like enzyme